MRHNVVLVIGIGKHNKQNNLMKGEKFMKERNFKFRRSYAEVVKTMDDKKAGQYIKAVCDYVFNGHVYNGKDTAISAAFSLTKVALDTDNFYREKGKLGAERLAEKKRSEKGETPVLARVIAGGEMAADLVKTIMDIMDSTTENDGKQPDKAVAK